MASLDPPRRFSAEKPLPTVAMDTPASQALAPASIPGAVHSATPAPPAPVTDPSAAAAPVAAAASTSQRLDTAGSRGPASSTAGQSVSRSPSLDRYGRGAGGRGVGGSAVLSTKPRTPDSVVGAGHMGDTTAGESTGVMASIRNLFASFSLVSSTPPTAVGVPHPSSQAPLRRPAAFEGVVHVKRNRAVMGTPHWVKRFARLEPSSRLCLYVTEKRPLPEDSVPLHAARVRVLDSQDGLGAFSVELSDASVLECRCEQQHVQAWFSAIKKAAARTKLAGVSIASDQVVSVDTDTFHNLGLSPTAAAAAGRGSHDVESGTLPAGVGLAEQWKCSLCTKLNEASAVRCATCGRANTFVPKAGVGACNHVLQSHRRMKALSVRMCAVCNKPISGMLGRCLKCKLCGVLLHTQCLRKAQTGLSASVGSFAAFSQSYRGSSHFINAAKLPPPHNATTVAVASALPPKPLVAMPTASSAGPTRRSPSLLPPTTAVCSPVPVTGSSTSMDVPTEGQASNRPAAATGAEEEGASGDGDGNVTVTAATPASVDETSGTGAPVPAEVVPSSVGVPASQPGASHDASGDGDAVITIPTPP